MRIHSLLLLLTASGAPVCPEHAYTLCILGADDAGSGAAWAARALNISTALTSWDARDLGGDLASGVRTDLFTSARKVGGLSLAYDRFARRAADAPCGFAGSARIAPPGPSFAWLDGVLGHPAQPSSVDFLPGWLPLPGGGIIDALGRVSGVTLVAEDNSTCVLRCRYAIEGTGEGYALRAFNQSIRFGREGVRTGANCSDATNCGESLAGRRVFGPCHPPREACNATPTVMGLAPRWSNVSDFGEEEEDVSSAASAIMMLRRYATDPTRVPANAPWLLAGPPLGFENGSFAFLQGIGFEGEGCLNKAGDVCRAEFEHAAGLPRWYEAPNPSGGSLPAIHYLRLPGSPWPPKRAVDRRNWWYATAALFYFQHYTESGRAWGLDNVSYSVAPACITTRDLGAPATGGPAYEQLSCRLYRRVTARLASPRGALGGEAMLPRPLFTSPTVGIARTLWEPTSLGVPLYPVDYRGVLLDTVPMPPWAGPEGLVSLVYGGLGGTDAHGLARRVLEPDPEADGMAPPVLNLLSPGAPRSTFQAQAALRIHATASNLGLGAVALVAATEALGLPSTAATPTALAQWTMAGLGGVVALFDGVLAGTETFAMAQLPGVLGVPPLNLAGYAPSTWAPPLPRRANATLWFAMYATGLLTGAIPRWPPAASGWGPTPAFPPPPPLPPGVSLPWASPTDPSPLTRADLAAWVDAISPASSAAVLALPIPMPSARVHLRDLRAVLTRHILALGSDSGAGAGGGGGIGESPRRLAASRRLLRAAGLDPYVFPDYALVDAHEVTGAETMEGGPDWPLGSPPCTTSEGMELDAGVLGRNATAPVPRSAILTRLCAVSGLVPSPPTLWWPAFTAWVDMALEQVPVPSGSPSLVNAGLLYLWGNASDGGHGWFGVLSDALASGADGAAGAGFDTSQALEWGLRLPGGKLLRATLPWRDGQGATFTLGIVHNGEGGITASVNGVVVLQGNATAPVAQASAPPAFGVRVGEGQGASVWGALVVVHGVGLKMGLGPTNGARIKQFG